ncbi:MAG TPA: aminotransferase class IV [Micromonosporaceae bacterium]
MADPQRVIALFGTGLVPPETPILRGDDLGVVRGDGIFETLHVRQGRAWLLEEHLARMARSAARMELTLPSVTELTELVATALRAWPAQAEGALRLVCTRGPESGSSVTLFATVFAVPVGNVLARRDGVRVVTATLGFPAQLRPATPWLLGGAKTLSYAVNMASLRWAKSVGADDVLWVSSDGYALEAPTATLVWLDGSTLRTVPAEATGVLAGTTAAHLLARAGELGLDAGEGLITPAGLAATAGAWLTSSVRGVAAIRTLDGATLPYDPELTERIRTLLGFRLP